MEDDSLDSIPCSSIAVDSAVRTSCAGLIWGSCAGPFEARRQGLSGNARTLLIAKTVGKFGFQCGLFGAIFSFSQCGMQRYRQRKDWVNTFSAGVVSGAAICPGTRNWKPIAFSVGLFCTFVEFANNHKSV